VLYGTLTSSTATSLLIATPNSGPSYTVKLVKNTKIVANSAAARAAGLQNTDAIAVKVGWHKNLPVAKVLRYDIAAFAFDNGVFSGTFVSWDGTTLVVNMGKKGAAQFTTGANTKFFSNGKLVSPPVFTHKEHVNVRAQHFTDGTWVATRVDLLVNKGKH
jgi:hypothetical protein